MATNTSQWMSDPAVQTRTLEQIVLPGTHDSGTNSLTFQLSQIPYSNIAFLWQLNPGQAPPGFPGSAPYYVGPALYDFVFQLVKDTAQAQDQPLLQQLQGGIRYFDLRVYWDTNANDLYIQHGLRGAPLSEILQDVGSFVSQSDGKELVFLEVSHTNFDSQLQGAQALVSQLNQYVGAQYLYTPSDLSTLAGTTLSSITGNGSRVIVLNTDTNVAYPAGSPVLTTSGFQNSGRDADGVDQASLLAQLEAQGLQQTRTCPLYHVAWTLTPQTSDIESAVVSRLENNPPQLVLQQLAYTANTQLQQFVSTYPQYSFNLITVDWYESSPVVNLAIQLSGGQVA